MKSPRILRLAACAVLFMGAQASTSLKEVSDDLVCQCGCSMVLSTCNMQNCGSATPMRAEIEARIEKGNGKDAIVASFVEAMGLKVLAAPPAEGFNLSAWIMPFVALVVGAVAAQRVLLSWRREGAAALAGARTAIHPSVSEEQRRRIERELKDFET